LCCQKIGDNLKFPVALLKFGDTDRNLQEFLVFKALFVEIDLNFQEAATAAASAARRATSPANARTVEAAGIPLAASAAKRATSPANARTRLRIPAG
jgi:hypothetical protein